MRKQIEVIILENKAGQRFRIYKVENANLFCMGLEGDNDHFEFETSEAKEIIESVESVVDSFVLEQKNR